MKLLVVEQPRIDYKDDSKGALLLEPSRSNNVDNSTNFFLNSWSGTRVLEGSTIVSPNGQDEAHKLIATSVDNTHYREYTISSASSGSYTGSCFFKKGEFNVGAIRMGVDSSANRYAIYIDLNDGTFLRDATVGSPTGTSYKIKNYGNGWYRLSVTITHTSGEVRMSLSNASSDYTNSNGLPLFLGNSSDGGYAWGAQLEQGSYATSYIPTQGSIVTRNQDVCNNGGVGVPIFSNTYAVWFMDLERIGVSDLDIGDSLTLRDDSNVRQITLWFDSPSKQIRFRDGKNSLTQIGGVMSTSEGTRKKIALKIDGETLKLFAEGSQVGANYTKVNSFDITQMTMQGIGYKIRNIKFYNTTLTDQELIALTSSE